MDKQLTLNFETDFLEDDAVFLPKAKQEQLQPDNVDTKVVKQYRAGATLKQITRDNGLSYGKVYEILNRMGVTLRHGRYSDSKSGKRITTMSQLEKNSIIEFYRAGFEVSEIMKTFNLNKHGLYSILDEAGVPRRHKHQFIALDIATIREPEQIFTVTPTSPTSPTIKAERKGNRLYVDVFVDKLLLQGAQEIVYRVNEAQPTIPFEIVKEEN